jgi:hypothetical protein
LAFSRDVEDDPLWQERAKLTSPPQQIEIECPACGRVYEDWHRASISLDLEGWDAGDPEIRAYLRECSTGTCRHCGDAQLQPRTDDSGRSR